MFHRALIVFFATSALGTSSLMAQSAGPVIPSYQVPERLKPYVDEDRIKGSATSVVELLKSSEFVAITDGLDRECDEEAKSFYRGMHLALAGFYLFTSQQEVGWPEYENPTQTTPMRALVDFGRGVLSRAWSPERLETSVEVFGLIDKLPKEHRADIETFLKRLKAFRQYHERLKLVRKELSDLYQRRDDTETMVYWDRYLPEGGVEGLKQRFPDKTPMNFDAELRQLVNKVRGVDQDPIGKCYEEGTGYKLRIRSNPEVTSEKMFLPTSYMVGFWERREAEGTAALAEYVLENAISAVQTPEGAAGPP